MLDILHATLEVFLAKRLIIEISGFFLKNHYFNYSNSSNNHLCFMIALTFKTRT